MHFKLLLPPPGNGKEVQSIKNNGHAPEALPPKLIFDKVWVADPLYGGYRRLPEDDPTYHDLHFRLGVRDLLDSIYNREERGSRKKKP